jgi:hypothetical protein
MSDEPKPEPSVMRDCVMDEASLRSLLEAARKAGVSLHSLDVREVDGRYVVNLRQRLVSTERGGDVQ